MMDSREYRRADSLRLRPKDFPDIKVYGGDGIGRDAHRAVLARLSHLMQSILMKSEEEEDVALIIPDVSGPVLDLTLELAYSGWLGGLGLTNISQVRDVCNILDMRQNEFVVRAEEKIHALKSAETTEAEGEDQDNSTLNSQTESRTKVQGSFQCKDCDKTFIYAKSFERHVLVCKNNELTHSELDSNVDKSCENLSEKERPFEPMEEGTPLVDCDLPDFDQPDDEMSEAFNALEDESTSQGEPFEPSSDVGGESEKTTSKSEAVDPLADAEVPKPKVKRRRGKKKKKEEQVKEVFKFVHYEAVTPPSAGGGADQSEAVAESYQSSTIYYCKFPDCTYKGAFRSLSNCKNHQLAFHASDEEKVFVCGDEDCEERFASKRLLTRHVNTAHSKRFACEICGRRFAERTRLAIHARVHTGEKPFVCEVCGFACSQRDNLKKHKIFRHRAHYAAEAAKASASGQPDKEGKDDFQLPPIRQFKCTVCDMTFLTKSNLVRHTRCRHEDSRHFVCETCGKDFKDSGALKQHTYSHGPAQFTCSECSMAFTSPLNLYRHTVRKHPTDGVKPHPCEECDKAYHTNFELKEHIEAVHEDVKYECHYCNRAIGRRTSLYRHLKNGRCPGMRVVSFVLPSGIGNEDKDKPRGVDKKLVVSEFVEDESPWAASTASEPVTYTKL